MLEEFQVLKIEISRMLLYAEWIVSDIYSQRLSLISEKVMGMVEVMESVSGRLTDAQLSEQLLLNFSLVMECMQNQDYLLMADYLNIGIKKLMIDYLEEKCAKDPVVYAYEEAWRTQWQHIVFDKENNIELLQKFRTLEELDSLGYKVENCSTGAVTVSKKVKGKEIYLHPNISPYEAAWVLAGEWGKERSSHYIILGGGLFYHITNLWNLDRSSQIEVYESDIYMLMIASVYALRGWIFANVTVHYDPGYRKFLSAAAKASKEEDTKVCMYYPSLLVIEEDSLRERLLTLFTEMDNMERWRIPLRRNFIFNIENVSHRVDELQDKWKGKNVFLIAGGPSLENNIEKLLEVGEKDIVLCVGRSFRRLTEEGIKPDYVIITDPKPDSILQITGLEQSNVPLILLSTAYLEITKSYQGEKYLLFQKDYLQAEHLAEKENALLFETGSSVATTALDLCIRMECNRVIFLGLDLAFTGNRFHHSEGSTNIQQENAVIVEDVFGNKVSTSRNLNMYHQWIERRIAREKDSDIEFIDATEGGAKIKGTKIMTMSEALIWSANL